MFTMLRETSSREGESIMEDKPQQQGEKPMRPDRDQARSSSFAGDMTKLFVNLGKTHGVTAKDFVGMFYREGQVPDGALGHIKLFPRHTIVEVPEECVEKSLMALSRAKLRGKPFRVHRDKQA
jgi:ATP-dependent RNA helicase DeaD